MATLTNAEIWIGQTRNELRYKVYVIGTKPAGNTTVWILGSAEARQSGLPGFPPQRAGFDTQAEAARFARTAFPTSARLAHFLTHDLNPLSLKIASAPILIQKVDIG